MNDNYRRKDNFMPRSMREAFGVDETYEPEIRCCSELFYKSKKSGATFFTATLIAFAGLVGILLYVAMQHSN